MMSKEIEGKNRVVKMPRNNEKPILLGWVVSLQCWIACQSNSVCSSQHFTGECHILLLLSPDYLASYANEFEISLTLIQRFDLITRVFVKLNWFQLRVWKTKFSFWMSKAEARKLFWYFSWKIFRKLWWRNKILGQVCLHLLRFSAHFRLDTMKFEILYIIWT